MIRKAQAILQGPTPLDLVAIGFYRFGEGAVCGREAIVARTGYTGEGGFELFLAPGDAAEVWRRLIDAGQPHGLRPAGLGARDTLRLEARMLLYGNDMDESTTLVEAGLGWIVYRDEAKGDFLGRAVLEPQKKGGASRRLVGFEIVQRGIARHGYPVLLGNEPVSSVIVPAAPAWAVPECNMDVSMPSRSRLPALPAMLWLAPEITRSHTAAAISVPASAASAAAVTTFAASPFTVVTFVAVVTVGITLFVPA